MPLLRVGSGRVVVSQGLLELARPRCFSELFEVPLAGAGLQVELERRTQHDPAEIAVPLDGSNVASGTYVVRGKRLEVVLPEEPTAAEAALKAAFALAVHRQGGLLLHASGISLEGRGVVAVGPSGAGKSTFARLCAGVGGRLLSDETIAFFPDGTIQGTPFRSDEDMVPLCEGVSLRAMLALRHGSEESMTPLSMNEAVPRILEQAYRPAPGEVSPPELLRRASLWAARPGMHLFTFRKHPDAGRFVAAWLG